MIDQMRRPAWGVIGKSVQGASHKRAELPNQDAIHWQPQSSSGPQLILAVSDGHGSAKHFRSDTGSQIATRVATKVVFENPLDGPQDFSNPSAIKRLADEQLPKAMVRAWEKEVDSDVESNPLSTSELDDLEEKAGAAARKAVKTNPRLAYGATLLTVLVTESFVLYLQLGDGDILTVAETGEVERPLPGDERLFANETTSLCSPHAWRDFRNHFQVISGTPPALILVSTDGYANSFRQDADFMQVGTDYLGLMRADGLDAVEGRLESWLVEASEAGSGDDITLGILCWMDAIENDAGAQASIASPMEP